MMSQRPQPVTSKFRRYYSNDIYSVYVDNSRSSSSGSTSSLTSVLHHDSYEDQSLESDFKDYLKIEDDQSDIVEGSVISGGLFCKRIIARQPHYPGARVTMIKHDETVNNLRECPVRKRKVFSKVNQKLTKSTKLNNSGPQIIKINNENVSQEKKIMRKIGNKSHSVSEKSNSSKKSIIEKHKSENSYSSNDFLSNSDVNSDMKISTKNVSEDRTGSSTPNSICLPNNDEIRVHEENANKILTAWEAWYLKKEKQQRKKQEKELSKEKEIHEKGNEEKLKRKEICHEKIKSWLVKKEEQQKKEIELMKKRQKNENNEKEKKKEEMIEKSSKKYVEWKLEKKKRDKMLEKEEKNLKIKVEAEKMIKQAKAANAFQRWFEEHKDHQMPVPYSYGISDGKLTSYYDKTSNPPPSFFNPDPWKPIIDIKQ